MKIALAADHAGYEIKEIVKSFLVGRSHEVMDFGTDSTDSMDYPDTAHPATQAVVEKQCGRGIFVCGTGQGMQLVANKYPGIRAALCWNVELAKMSRLHNDANILALPGKFIDGKTAEVIVETWLSTEFEGGRHIKRVRKIHNPGFSEDR